MSASAIDALIDASPFYRWLGLRAADDGAVVLEAREHHIGDSEHALLHGGAIASLLEAAAELHLRAVLGPDLDVHVVEVTTDFLRPVPAGDVHSTVTVVRQGKRVANVRVEAWQGQPDRTLAVAHGTWTLAPRVVDPVSGGAR